MTNAMNRYRMANAAGLVVLILQGAWVVAEMLGGARALWEFAIMPACYVILQLFLILPRTIANLHFEPKNLIFIP